MNKSLAACAALAAVLLAGCAIYSPIGRVYDLEQVRSERVATADGAKIGLTTYTPAGEPRGTALLLPELFADRREFDLDREHSLARHLVRRGWTVVVAEWRGTGLSDKPDWANGQTYTWTLAQMLQNDLPAAVAHAAAAGPAPLVVWAHGHAGVLALAGLELDPGMPIAALVGLGVPGRHFDFNQIQQALAGQIGRLDPFRGVDCALAARQRAPFQGEQASVAEILLFNDKLFEPAVVSDFCERGFSVQSVSVAGSIVDWWRAGDLKIAQPEGELNVSAGLNGVKLPVYLAVGKLDNYVTPGESIALYDGLGSTAKQLRVFSQANGCDDNYGHMGLLLGPNAAGEVWDPALRWLHEQGIW